MPTDNRPSLSEITPAWVTRVLATNSAYAGRTVRSFHYEEVAAGPGLTGTVARFHLVFTDATKGEITLPAPASAADPVSCTRSDS